MKIAAFLIALLTSTAALADDDGGMRAFLLGNQSTKTAVVASHKGKAPSGANYITAAAQRHGLNPRLLHAVVKVESGGNCKARSWANAQGVGQVKPATARSVGVYGNLYNCETGIEAAARYLKVALSKPGSLCSKVSLYNRGVFARPTCTGYGLKVLASL